MKFFSMPRTLLVLALLSGAGFLPAAAQTIETTARQAIMVDFETGTVLFEKNADERMPPSSMSKLMTAVMVFDRVKEGSLKYDDRLTVTERAWRMQGSKMFAKLGDSVRIEDLIRGMIIQSGNDACVVLAEGLGGSEEAFAEKMNKRAREIGLTGSNFRNSTGWPDPDHYMTARDLSVLAAHIIRSYPDQYHFYSEQDFEWNGIKQGNRNPLLYRPGSGVDGLKTGHTDLAGYGLTASAKRGDRRLILVVNGLKSMQDRADETDRLMDWGFREFERYMLVEAGQKIDNLPVWLGEAATVPVTVEAPVMASMARTVRPKVTAMLKYPGPVQAPVKVGTKVGTLVVDVPGRPAMEVPLVAASDVPQLGGFARIGAALRHLTGGAGA